MSLKTTYTSTEIGPFYSGNSVASISKDGSLLATALEEDISITDLTTNEVIHTLEGDGEPVTCLQLTPDGKYLAVVSQSQQMRIFNLTESKFVKSHRLSSSAYVASVDPTNTLFAFGITDGSIIVFDIENGFVTHSLKGHGAAITALKFDGELNSSKWKLVSGDLNGVIKVWDLVKRKAIATLNEHENAVRGFAFAGDDSQYLVSGGRDDIVIVWDTKYWKSKKIISAQQKIEALTLLDQDHVCTGGDEPVLKVWSISKGILIAETKKPIEEMEIIGLLPTDHNSLFIVYSDQTIAEVDTTLIEQGREIEISRTIAGNHGTIADMRYVGPSKQLLALATNSPGLRIFDPVNFPLEVTILEGHTDILNCIDATKDGLWIATGAKDNEARIWHYNDDSDEFEIYAICKGHAGSVSAIGFPRTHEDGSVPKFVITGSSDLTVKKWKIPKVKNEQLPIVINTSDYTRHAHEKDMTSLDISPNDEFFATCSFDKVGKVWDLDTGETVGLLKGHKRGLLNVTFSIYDKTIFTGGMDKTAKLWNLQDFTCQRTFEGHTNAVQRATYLNSEKQVVTTGADGLVKIWDSNTGDCLKTLDKHANRIWALVVKDNGEEFVTADADGFFQFWIDNTDEVNKEEEEAQRLKVEQEQNLQNYMNQGEWGNAFLLALTLDQPMRLYTVLKNSIGQNKSDEFIIGEELDCVIKTLNGDQILLLFKRIRTWNVNARFFSVAQKLIRCILQSFDVEKLIEIPGLMAFIDAILPYNERHYSRIDDLIEQSFILDYSIAEMDKL
jgi:U3 small nucleolar RNA-associated protein 13